MAYILLVDDDPESLWALQVALESDGHRVTIAAAAPQALAVLRHEAVQVMITDYEMPDIDGAELCRRARAQPAYCALPIVMLSAAPEPKSPRHWTSFLRKPVRLDELTAIIDAHAAVRRPRWTAPVRALPLFANSYAVRWPGLDPRRWP